MRARALLFLLLVLSSACLWRSYDSVMRVHLDVLSSMADKAAGKAESGHRPASNDVTELTYPLQRARQFAYQYRNYADRSSYALFTAALDRYQALVDTVDAARGDEARWTAARAEIAARYAAWREAAAQVASALEREA